MGNSEDALATDLEPLMLELGKAVFICQSLESSLCLLHAYMTLEEIDGERKTKKEWDFHSSKTLGFTINALRKRIDLPDKLSDYLEQGSKCRNQIIHGFITKNMLRCLESKGRIEVEAELSALKDEVKKRDIVVNRLLDALFAKHGFSNEDLK